MSALCQFLKCLAINKIRDVFLASNRILKVLKVHSNTYTMVQHISVKSQCVFVNLFDTFCIIVTYSGIKILKVLTVY